MQTLDFTRALTDIVAELKIRELWLILEAWIKTVTNSPAQQPVDVGQKKVFTTLLFESHAGYDRLMRVETTHKLLDSMETKELYEPGRLASLMHLVTSAPHLAQLRGGNPELLEFYETLRSYLRIEKTCRQLLQDEKIGSTAPNHKTLELQLTDYDGQGVEPKRLSEAFSQIAELQMNLTRLLGVSDDRVAIKYLDSGSDIKIGLEGVKEAIDAMGDLFLRFWDRIRFRDQDTFEKDVEALSKGLEFLNKAKESVDKGAISEEEAKNLKARVFRGVNELVGLGVTLPLSGENAADERKQLIEKRSTKLLTSGNQPEVEVQGGPTATS